jgi:putative transposase
MARTRYRIFETHFPYFLTCTIVGWLPVLTRPECVQIVMDSWRFLQRENRLQIFGYVVLENHIHFIGKSTKLSTQLGDFKSYTARKIIDWLEKRNETTLLRQLKHEKAHHKQDRTYQVWQEGSHPKQIQNENSMRQKLDYIHYNPVKRGYVDDPIHWRYSSARNYTGLPGLMEITTDWI